jgi:hypothetical protein
MDPENASDSIRIHREFGSNQIERNSSSDLQKPAVASKIGSGSKLRAVEENSGSAVV